MEHIPIPDKEYLDDILTNPEAAAEFREILTSALWDTLLGPFRRKHPNAKIDFSEVALAPETPIFLADIIMDVFEELGQGTGETWVISRKSGNG